MRKQVIQSSLVYRARPGAEDAEREDAKLLVTLDRLHGEQLRAPPQPRENMAIQLADVDENKHVSYQEFLDALRSLNETRVVGLAERGPIKASDLSHGERRLLELGLALAAQPGLLLLDEPLAGTGPEDCRPRERLAMGPHSCRESG